VAGCGLPPESIAGEQIAICAMLSLLRWLPSVAWCALCTTISLEPKNAMLASADLHMAGYTGIECPHAKAMIDAVAAIPE